MRDVVVGVTGASGAAYAIRLLEALLKAGQNVQAVFSGAAKQVLHQELRVKVPSGAVTLPDLLPTEPEIVSAYGGWSREALEEELRARPVSGALTIHPLGSYAAGIASGSYLTRGMVVCPCSMDTLGSLAAGLCGNLIHRAAGVHMKERRKLILVPRETPLSTIQLENMTKLSASGVVVLPAMPGLYHHPTSLLDTTDFIVSRILDQLGIENRLIGRWGDEELEEE